MKGPGGLHPFSIHIEPKVAQLLIWEPLPVEELGNNGTNRSRTVGLISQLSLEHPLQVLLEAEGVQQPSQSWESSAL